MRKKSAALPFRQSETLFQCPWQGETLRQSPRESLFQRPIVERLFRSPEALLQRPEPEGLFQTPKALCKSPRPRRQAQA